MARILVFAGSARRDSLNKKLAVVAAAKAQRLGATVTLIDLADFPIPIFKGDLESSDHPPENAAKLRQLLLEHDALLIAAPEYNGSITPLLKKSIDWTSRPADGLPSLAAYTGKVGALVSASPGGLGGLRGLVHVRAILSGIGVLVIPQQLAIGGAHKVITEDSSLADERLDTRLDAVVAQLVEVADALGQDAAPSAEGD